MRKPYRPALLFMLISLLIPLCYACAQEDAAERLPEYQYVIGVSQANLIEPWRIALYEEMRAQGNTHDNLRLIFTDAVGDYKRQIDDVEHFLEIGVDLLIISPNDDAQLAGIISEAYRQIPVIVLDRDVGGDYSMFIGSDNRMIGLLAGRYAVELLGEEGGVVLEITGDKNSPPTQALSEGFSQAIAEHPNITRAGSIDGDWLRDTAERRMKDYLIVSEKVDVVFAHNDAMAYGAYIAARDLRVSGIQFIGADGLDSEGKELTERGVLAGTFFRHTGGKEAVEWALKILNGEKITAKEIILEPVPINPSNR